MLITDQNEIVRIKLVHGGRYSGKLVSFAEFILPVSYRHLLEPFCLPLTPNFGVKYLTALVEEEDDYQSIYYLEMSGESYSISGTGSTPFIAGNQNGVRFEWKRMTAGKYYDDNRY